MSDATPPYTSALFSTLSVLELCAGAGGQALGLEQAGLDLLAAVEFDPNAAATLRLNRPNWDVREEDLLEFDGRPFEGVDVLAAGVPCPPFSIAGKQLGHEDERDLFPAALRIVAQARPRAVLFENVRGLATSRFSEYRHSVQAELAKLGYESDWRVLNASDFGVPQLRPRWVLVGLRSEDFRRFDWPTSVYPAPTVGETLRSQMGAGGWLGVNLWADRANGIAPTVVGGSKKHGGPDLGPTRAREEWARLGVDGKGVADHPPPPTFPVGGMPRLTVEMVARVQGFPPGWHFSGTKTARYRQVGNAFPPPVARAVGAAVRAALLSVDDPIPARRLLESSLDAIPGD